MTFDSATFREITERFRQGKPSENSRLVQFSLWDLVVELLPDIDALRADGYSLKGIAEYLRATGASLRLTTLKNYIRRARRQRAQAAPAPAQPTPRTRQRPARRKPSENNGASPSPSPHESRGLGPGNTGSSSGEPSKAQTIIQRNVEVPSAGLTTHAAAIAQVSRHASDSAQSTPISVPVQDGSPSGEPVSSRAPVPQTPDGSLDGGARKQMHPADRNADTQTKGDGAPGPSSTESATSLRTAADAAAGRLLLERARTARTDMAQFGFTPPSQHHDLLAPRGTVNNAPRDTERKS